MRGPKHHLKRLRAPRHWMLSKMGGIYAPRPSQGPHKLRECLPLVLVLRNRLKYALTRREVVMITMRRLIAVDHKVRTDINYPAGFQDIISIQKTGEHFRLMYDTKGRFCLQKIPGNQANVKLCRVQRVSRGNKASIGRNPFVHGKNSSIPYIVTHDGRTIRYPDPQIAANDTVKFNLKTQKIVGFIKCDLNNLVMVTRGANIGRVGTLVHLEKHPGSHTIVHIKDKRDHQFATRLENVFVIGEGDEPAITLPKAKGVKLSILEEREAESERRRNPNRPKKSKGKK